MTLHTDGMKVSARAWPGGRGATAGDALALVLRRRTNRVSATLIDFRDNRPDHCSFPPRELEGRLELQAA